MTEPKSAAGADLARQALAAYKATAPKHGAPKPRTRARRADRGAGRDPVGLSGLLGRLNTEQGWGLSLSAGSITDRWTALCPELVGHVEPVAYDAERGRLDLRPATHAYAAHLRLLGGQIAKRINDQLGRQVIRSIRPLPVGPITATSAATAPGRPSVQRPIRTRDTACDGYKEALAAIRRPEKPTVNPKAAAAIERQNQAMAREPEDQFTDAVVAAEEAAGPQLSDSERARQAAIAHKHTGGHTAPVRRVFDVA
ncbi:putative Tra3-like protein [Streptomyces phage ZL12]|uniref:Putative Tra3-like protein n=1 Tax=Streptomyces phage ZL12 TaxID=2570911 RepID=D0UWC3_9CAUD|nr:putative Tra3-like protein [Streptomyces phage ZL12]ACX71095.1 putative Tra3-like protein [Streptomyces phage ZL12]